ncbi:MAG: hypothetical protein V8R27_03600 [Oscillospiraceae bacterium]
MREAAPKKTIGREPEVTRLADAAESLGQEAYGVQLIKMKKEKKGKSKMK